MHVPWVPIPNRTVALVEDTRSNPIMKHEFGLPMDPENSQTSFQTVNIQEASRIFCLDLIMARPHQLFQGVSSLVGHLEEQVGASTSFQLPDRIRRCKR